LKFGRLKNLTQLDKNFFYVIPAEAIIHTIREIIIIKKKNLILYQQQDLFIKI